MRGGHWIVGTTSNKGKVVTVYDSLYDSLDQVTAVMIQNFFIAVHVMIIKLVPSEISKARWISRLWIVCNRQSPRNLHHCQMQMREHLEARKTDTFPITRQFNFSCAQFIQSLLINYKSLSFSVIPASTSKAILNNIWIGLNMRKCIHKPSSTQWL